MNNPLSSLSQQARNAYYGLSFSPEKRGDSVINDYGAELLEDIEQITKAATAYDKDPGAAIARYTQKYKEYISRWLSSQSNCFSTMIAGPSNYPVERQRKRHQWAENKYTEFREWRTRVLAKICKGFAPPVTPLTELEKARQDLKKGEERQELYHKINKAWRAFNKKPESLDASDLSEGIKNMIRSYDPQNCHHGQPIARYQFSNNNANIKRLKDRVAMLEAKAVKHEAREESEQTINGVRILQNYGEDRVQIFFPGKPEQSIIDALKRRGWRWSPYFKAWQRKLTNDATWSAQEIAKQVKVN